MTKPLWTFFNSLREKSSQTLSLDQYFDFFTAFNEMNLDHIGNMQELRDFCKIFWLNNDSFEDEFHLLFEQYTSILELEALLKDKTQKVEDSKVKDPKLKDDISGGPVTETDGGGGEDPRPRPTPPPIPEHKSDEIYSDFELLVGDVSSNIRSRKRRYISHQFNLDDHSIIPFKPRYLTQRLRRKVESPKIEWTDELDFELMIDEYSKNQFIDEIKYQKKETSQSHVVLLCDHWGSMLAYEYLEKEIANSIMSIPGCRFEHFRFQNLPEYNPKTKGYNMLKIDAGEIDTESTKTMWDSNTWIFLLSDGGALSGMLNRGRMRASFQLWNYLKSKTNHVFWINPVSKEYRKGTTAARLNKSIPMIFPVQRELNTFFNKA